MESNFKFLEKNWEDLYEIGKTAERCLYDDANNSVIKIGMLAEKIVRYMFEYENIDIPVDDSQSNMIRILNRQYNLIPSDINNLLYTIRKTRNEAAHLYIDSVNTAKGILELGYKLSCWFMEVYGDWSFSPAEYVEPVKEEELDVRAFIEKQNERIAELEKDISLIKTTASNKSKEEREEKAKEAAEDIISTLENDSPAKAITTQTESLRFEIDSNPVISLCLEQNKYKVINSIRVFKKDEESLLKNLSLRIVSNPNFTYDYEKEISFFTGKELIVNDIDIKLNLNEIIKLTERIDGYLEIKLINNETEEILVNEIVEIGILPRNYWQGTSILTDTLASFVTPNSPDISRIIGAAAEKMYQLTGSSGFSGYQTNDPNDVLNQAAAIYYAIKDLNIVYVEAPQSYERLGQRIRLSDEIYKTKQGNCIDISALYASCLESVGLNPFLVLEKTHAFVGVWLFDYNLSDTVTDDQSQIVKRFAEGVGEATVLESTFMCYGNSADFNAAQNHSKIRMLEDDGKTEFIIDIRCCRLSSIKPLPLVMEKDGEWIIEHESIADTQINNPNYVSRMDVDLDGKPITKKEQWEKKLLDLGLRNPLINLRLSRAIIPVLSSNGCSEIVDSLLAGNDAKLFEIKPCPKQWPKDPLKDRFESFGHSAETEPLFDILSKGMSGKKLYTPFDDVMLEKRLKQLYRNERQSVEESGANTLYLASGLMKWCEKGIEKEHYAPLVLIPVTLTKRTGNAGYFLSYRSDDAQINITLIEKLKHDFDINITGLEEVPEKENGDPDILLINSIFNKAIMSKKNWTILNSCYIGNFSFSQFVMWNDIHSKLDTLEKNKIVKSLIDGKLSWDAKPMKYEGQIDAGDTRLAIPVDGSQLYAVKEANEGESFVLHGPPGTGKSQTITALIGNALAHGKRVLFVAEKRAALEVVQRRLEEIGIGPFCLELHSNKAKKSEVLSQLNNVLELAKKESTRDFKNQLNKLNKSKKELDEYVIELHKKRDCGYSAYELINKYEENSNFDFLTSDLEIDVDNLTKDEIDDLVSTVEDLITKAKLAGTPSENPLRYVGLSTYSHGLRDESEEALKTYLDSLAELEAAKNHLEMILPDVEYSRKDDYSKLYSSINRLITIMDIPENFAQLEDNEEVLSSIMKMCSDFVTCNDILTTLMSGWNDEIFDFNFDEFLKKYRDTNSILPIDNAFDIRKKREINEYFDELSSYCKHNIRKNELDRLLMKNWKESFLNLDGKGLLSDYLKAENSWFLPRAININKLIKKLQSYSIMPIDKQNLRSNLEWLVEFEEEYECCESYRIKHPNALGALWMGSHTNWEAVDNDSEKARNMALELSDQISDLSKDMVNEKKLLEAQSSVETYRSIRNEAEEYLSEYGGELGALYQEDETSWEDVLSVIDNINDRILSFDEVDDDNRRLRLSFGGNDEMSGEFDSYIHAFDTFAKNYEEVYNLLEIKDHPSDDWMPNEESMFENILENVGKLNSWIAWNDICNRAAEEGLSPVVDSYYAGYTNGQIFGSFYKTLFRQLISKTVEESDILNKFSGLLFEDRINKFKEIDRNFTEVSKKEIYYTLLSSLPIKTAMASESSELGILQKAIRNNGRGVSVRKLFEKIPNLLNGLSPCMLMSPMSVAQYLDPNRKPFDLVVFDEASQLQTCKAVGAIARGENAVIVGDPNQMPPTTFFMTATKDDEENFEIEDLESILDDCLALSMPETNLLWHYRSRHESLIAFSNSQFYNNKLYTFPSVNDRESKVSLVQVNGTFTRKGGAKRTNNIEAARVVGEIKNRYKDKTHSSQSLGVVTFNIAQSNLIEDLLNDEFANDSDFETWANRDNEPLFVKNLENVQGDERDVILFSVTYGPDETGKVSMNFGPLNKEKGWRRLNVAASRAKEEMVVFSSLRPEQIDTNKTKAKGVQALKSFLEYAGKGELEVVPNYQIYEEETMMGIAKSIVSKLKDRGFKTELNVGKSGYKVDVAVVDPREPDRYILGILLDGAVYRDSSTVRDREIGQISVLQGLGWKITRVWTMDWWDDSKSVMNKIMEKIASILKGEDESERQIEIAEEKMEEEYEETIIQSPEKTLDLMYEYKPSNSVNYKGFVYEPKDFPIMPRKTLVSGIVSVLKDESPATLNVLSNRVAKYFGCSKATFNVRETVYKTCNYSANRINNRIFGEDVYWFDPALKSAVDYKLFRHVSDTKDISFGDIPMIEIVNALCYVLYNNFAMTLEDLIKATSKTIGYNTGTTIKERITRAVEYAIDEDYIEDDHHGSLMLKQEYRKLLSEWGEKHKNDSPKNNGNNIPKQKTSNSNGIKTNQSAISVKDSLKTSTIVSKTSDSSNSQDSSKSIIDLLEKHKLKYLDKRNKGGCLWVIGGKELEPIMLEAKKIGYNFTFSPKGGRLTENESAWWTSTGSVSGSSGQSKKVAKMDEKGKVITIYPSVKEAARSVNRDPKCIRDAIDGIQKTAGGYCWKYLD